MTPPANGRSAAQKFRAEIHMHLVIDSDSYGDVGIVMDKIAKAVRRELPEAARFDFTGFQTHPCKQAKMMALAMQDVEYANVGAAGPAVGPPY